MDTNLKRLIRLAIIGDGFKFLLLGIIIIYQLLVFEKISCCRIRFAIAIQIAYGY
jgi:hypothetical protein